MPRRAFAIAAWLSLSWASIPAQAVSTGRLPAHVCDPNAPDLFASGFENSEPTRYREASNGSGGAFPGAQSRSIIVNAQTRSYYLHIPAGYPFAEPAPLLLVLHGAGGPGTAPAAAQALRNAWAATANAAGFIVAAPIGSGPTGGGWVPIHDYPMLQVLIDDVAAHYNIDRSRIHGWGFSAGGHVIHNLALNQRNTAPDIRTFAAYSVSAGLLQALTCNSSSSCIAHLSQLPRKIPADLRVGQWDSLQPGVQGNYSLFLSAGWSADTVAYTSFPADHEISPGQFPAIWQFLCPFQRLPQ